LEVFSIPASLVELDDTALWQTSPCDISVEDGNRLFSTNGSLLMNFDGTIIRASYGRNAELVIPNHVETMPGHCFACAEHLSVVTFEAECQISVIPAHAFANCTSLCSISIPPSVETLGASCFAGCGRLSGVVFEPGSRLSYIDAGAFAGCLSLS
jgi:hypothetical protein